MLTRARQAARLAGFVTITSSLLPAFLAAEATAKTRDREAVRDRWTRRWSRALLRLFSIEREIQGKIAPATRGRLVVANHRSTIDIGIMLDLFGGRMVSRADLANWPVIGIAARKTGTVFVDRSKKSSGAAVIRVMRDLLAAGETVCVFPEGTTFADDLVRPFHPGAFVAAARANAEIIPVGIVYERGSGAAFVDEPFMDHLARLAGATASRVRVVIGDPSPSTSAATTQKRLRKKRTMPYKSSSIERASDFELRAANAAKPPNKVPLRIRKNLHETGLKHLGAVCLDDAAQGLDRCSAGSAGRQRLLALRRPRWLVGRLRLLEL